MWGSEGTGCHGSLSDAGEAWKRLDFADQTASSCETETGGPKECQSFAYDVSDAFVIEELLCVSDLCISDYSSLVFEYSLFERPMLFFAYDFEEYGEWRGFYYDYHELTPGPVVHTTQEIVDYVLHLKERFDRKQVADSRRNL